LAGLVIYHLLDSDALPAGMGHIFTLGSPVGLLAAKSKSSSSRKCHGFYNIFMQDYDPLSLRFVLVYFLFHLFCLLRRLTILSELVRLEPFLTRTFVDIPPVTLVRSVFFPPIFKFVRSFEF
jgi:hypothetical protein